MGIRLVLVEDEHLYRDLLRAALERSSGVRVVGSFSSGAEALAWVPELRPDAVIMDVDLADDHNGIEVGIKLRRVMPDLGVVVLTNHPEVSYLLSVPDSEIAGWAFLLKRSVRDLATLERAITEACNGGVMVDPELLAKRDRYTRGQVAALSPRLRETLKLIAAGFTNAAIADQLDISEKTVENHVGQIYQALGVSREYSALHPRVNAVLRYLRETR